MKVDLNVRSHYGQALFRVAGAAGRLDAVSAEARSLAAYLESRLDSRMRAFIESPHVPDMEKRDLINRMFEGRIDPLLIRFCLLMIDRRRTLLIVSSLREFCALVDESEGVFDGTVTTATPLTDEEKTALALALEKRTAVRLRIRFLVEPAIIGGVVFHRKGQLIDGSLRSALRGLRRTLKKRQGAL